MASIANMSDWLAGLAGVKEPNREERGPSIWPLPGEDIFFMQKEIDNSQVRKARNREEEGTCVQAVAMIASVCLFVFALLLPSMLNVVEGMEVGRLQGERDMLIRQNDELDANIAGLKSPDRLMREAKRLGFITDETVHHQRHLNPNEEGLNAQLRVSSGLKVAR